MPRINVNVQIAIFNDFVGIFLTIYEENGKEIRDKMINEGERLKLIIYGDIINIII